MVRVFVDTNYFIGIANRTPEIDALSLDQYECFLSPLSAHILFYVNKIKVPHMRTNSYIEDFNFVPLDQNILMKALIGPTIDLEDNIQLHSAAQAECDVFLTHDVRLLKMRFFGKVKVASSLIE